MKTTSAVLSTPLLLCLLVLVLQAMAAANQLDAPRDQVEAHQVSDGVDMPRDAGGVLRVNAGPKRDWPEVVGLPADEAEKKIKQDMPFAIIKVVPQDAIVTMDFNQRRIRIFVDPAGKVARAPRIG